MIVVAATNLSAGLLDPCLYGCLAGIAISAFITITISIFKPDHYDWESLSALRVLTEDGDEVDVAKADTAAYDPEKLRKAAILARSVTLFLFVGSLPFLTLIIANVLRLPACSLVRLVSELHPRAAC